MWKTKGNKGKRGNTKYLLDRASMYAAQSAPKESTSKWKAAAREMTCLFPVSASVGNSVAHILSSRYKL